MKWKCKEKHEWEATYHAIKSGHWCPHCVGIARLTLEDCHKTAKERCGECLSTEYINSKTLMRWKCKEDHEWEACYGNIKNSNSWCVICAGNAKHTIEECQKTAEERGGMCLSFEYINNQTKIKWQCKYGHKWEACYGNIKNSNQWCPHCYIFKHEEECRTIMENIYNKPFPKGRHSFLINPETKHPLELDGYNKELKIAFDIKDDSIMKP